MTIRTTCRTRIAAFNDKPCDIRDELAFGIAAEHARQYAGEELDKQSSSMLRPTASGTS